MSAPGDTRRSIRGAWLAIAAIASLALVVWLIFSPRALRNAGPLPHGTSGPGSATSSPTDRSASSARRAAAARTLSPNSAYNRYMASKRDLYAYYMERASSGPSRDDKYYMAEALRRCRITARKAIAADDARGCSGFQRTNLDLDAKAVELRGQAISEGSFVALASDLADLQRRDPREAADVAQQILASGDSSAINGLWDYVAASEEYLKRMPDATPARMREAWVLTMCDLGLDCVAGSRTPAPGKEVLQLRESLRQALVTGDGAPLGIPDSR